MLSQAEMWAAKRSTEDRLEVAMEPSLDVRSIHFFVVCMRAVKGPGRPRTRKRNGRCQVGRSLGTWL